MTTPTADQLAVNVPPAIREYIDAKIEEVIAARRVQWKARAESMAQVSEVLTARMAQMEQFERQVRSHLGIYIQEE